MPGATLTPALASLLHRTRQTISHRWYKGESLTLDGYNFVRCRFDDCKIHYYSDDFRIVECLFDRSVILHPMSSVRVIRLYWAAQGQSGPPLGTFSPLRSLDGTISTDESLA